MPRRNPGFLLYWIQHRALKMDRVYRFGIISYWTKTKPAFHKNLLSFEFSYKVQVIIRRINQPLTKFVFTHSLLNWNTMTLKMDRVSLEENFKKKCTNFVHSSIIKNGGHLASFESPERRASHCTKTKIRTSLRTVTITSTSLTWWGAKLSAVRRKPLISPE